MTDTDFFRNIQGHIDNSLLPALQELSGKWAEVESVDKEREKAEAKLASVKANVAAMRAEFSEVKRAHEQIIAKAREDQAKHEKLQAEIKRKTAELGKVNAEFDRLRQFFREFDALEPGFKKLSDLMSDTKAAVGSLRMKLGA